MKDIILVEKYQGNELTTYLQAPNKTALNRLIKDTKVFAENHGLGKIDVVNKKPDPDGGWEAIIKAHNENPIKWLKAKIEEKKLKKKYKYKRTGKYTMERESPVMQDVRKEIKAQDEAEKIAEKERKQGIKERQSNIKIRELQSKEKLELAKTRTKLKIIRAKSGLSKSKHVRRKRKTIRVKVLKPRQVPSLSRIIAG